MAGDDEIDWAEVAKIAYGPEPEDGVLLTGKQARQFAKAAIANTLKAYRLWKEEKNAEASAQEEAEAW